MWQRGVCCVETGARWSWVAKSGSISVDVESIRWESAELAEERFSELGLVLGFMGFGFALELEVCEAVTIPCGAVFGKEGPKGLS